LTAAGLPSGVEYWRRVDPALPLGECEMLSELQRITLEPADIGAGEGVRLNEVTYPYAMILSQDCDLEWDQTARRHIESAGAPPAIGQARIDWDRADKDARTKLMEGVLICVAEEESVVRVTSALPSKQWQFAESNQHERYHFLRPCAPDVDLEGVGLPQLVLDFKRYFTIPPEELRRRCALSEATPGRARRRSVLVSPFLEDVSTRFYRFQARVALPDQMRPA
jgi:hypothetical protein